MKEHRPLLSGKVVLLVFRDFVYVHRRTSFRSERFLYEGDGRRQYSMHTVECISMRIYGRPGGKVTEHFNSNEKDRYADYRTVIPARSGSSSQSWYSVVNTFFGVRSHSHNGRPIERETSFIAKAVPFAISLALCIGRPVCRIKLYLSSPAVDYQTLTRIQDKGHWLAGVVEPRVYRW